MLILESKWGLNEIIYLMWKLTNLFLWFTGTLTRQSQCNTIQRPPSYRAPADGQQLVSSTPSYQSSTTQTVPQPQPPPPPSVTATATSTAVSSTMTTSQSHSPHLNSLQSFTQNQSHHSSHHDINRVTILQTTNTSQVCTPNGVNIVAISPTTIMAANAPQPNLCANIVSSNEVQILAHV